MSGATWTSGVGDIGLQIIDKSEPDITVVTFMNRTKVYVRRTKRWKEAIAEFVDPLHAQRFVQSLAYLDEVTHT